MDSKKVWGAIIIILGVMLVFGGFHEDSISDFAEREISYFIENKGIIMDCISLLIGLVSLGIAIYSLYKLQKIKRLININAGSITDSSHSILESLKLLKLSPELIERYGSFNHSLLLFLGNIGEKFAIEYIAVNKDSKDWALWANKFQVDIKKIKKCHKKLNKLEL